MKTELMMCLSSSLLMWCAIFQTETGGFSASVSGYFSVFFILVSTLPFFTHSLTQHIAQKSGLTWVLNLYYSSDFAVPIK